MGLWRRLVAVVDPAEGYFDRQRPRVRAGPLARGGVTHGPGVPGGSRAATEAELAELAQRSAQERLHRHDDRATRVAEVQRRWGAHVHRAAQELLVDGSAQLVVADRVVQARLVRFWYGDPVLHVVQEGLGGGGESITRLPRRRLGGPAGTALLEGYLTSAAAG